MGSIGTWVLLAGLMALGLVTLAAAARAARRGGEDEPGGDGDDRGGGGGGGGSGDGPSGPGGGIDWATFEREFWAYVECGRPRSPARRRR